jgi:hypothetical protein
LLDSGEVTAAVPGPTTSGFITASATGTTVTASAAFFDAGMVGKTIRFQNGTRRVIATFVSATRVTVTVALVSPLGAMRFAVLNGAVDSTVTSSANFFSAEMVGQRILWDNGATRVIKSYISPTQVTVHDDTQVVSGLFGVTQAPFGRWTGEVTRIPYRTIWSMNDAPTRFNATVAGSMTAGSRFLTLVHPTNSFPIGQDVIVLGAGVLGGNLTSMVEAINGLVLTLHDAAQTSVTESPVARADTVGSIVGFFDIQDDGSAILRSLTLRGFLVVYKETSIFVGQYTGNRAAPWDFQKVYGDEEGDTSETQSKCLRYRNTLIAVNGVYHIYAGRSSFYRFDLTTRLPTELPVEVCKDLFFRHADIKDDDWIFAAFNGLTKEVFICLPPQRFSGEPGSTPWLPEGVGSFNPGPRLIRFDTMYGTVSTSPVSYTAAATVLLDAGPDDGSPAGPGRSDRYFLMGLVDGLINRYGLQEKPPEMLFIDVVGGPIALTVTSDVALTGGHTTSGSAVVTNLPATDLLQPGAAVTGTGIPEDTTIFSVDSATQITLSANATLTNVTGLLVLSFDMGAMMWTADVKLVAKSVPGVFRADHLYATLMCNDADRTCFAIMGFVDATHLLVKGPATNIACTGMTIIFASYVRDGVPMASQLRSGLEGWGDPLHEKVIGDFVLNAASGVATEGFLSGPSASAPNVPVSFAIFGARSAAQTPLLLGSKVIADVAAGGLVPMHFKQVYTQDLLTVLGVGPFGITSRMYNVAKTKSVVGRFKGT